MIRRFLISMGLVALLASAQIAAADTPPIVLTHQGRLLDASDQPVNGTVSLTFKIYEAQTGGVPLWMELHPAVSVHDGLFTEQLGEVVPLPVDVLSAPEVASSPRWLEIEVAGVPLVPRTKLTATPAAAVTSRVAGDISTGPGSVRIGGMSGSTTGTIRMAAVHDSAGTIISQDDNGDGIAESSVSSKTKGTKATGGYVGGMSGSTTGTIRMAASPDSTESVLEQDSDGDGLPESSASSKLIGVTGNNLLAGRSGSTTGTIRMAASPDSSESVLGQDGNGDGVTESSVSSKTKGTKATGGYVGGMSGSTTGTIRMAASPDSTTSDLDQDSNGDGVSESSVSSKTKGFVASGGIRGGMSGSTTGTIRMAASPDSTTSVLDQDSNGDGVSESSVSSKTKGFVASGGIRGGMSGSTTGTIRMAASPDSTNTAMDSDTNGDGIPESSVKSKTSGPRAGSILSGMSGSTTGTIRMSAAPESTMTVLGTDTDGNGTPENTLIQKSKGTQATGTLSGRSGSTTATIRMQASGSGQGGGSSVVAAELDNDGDSDPDGGGFLEAKESRATLKTYFENGDIPTQDNLVQTTCDADAAELLLRRPPTALLTWGTGLAFRVDHSGPSITMDVDSVPTFTVNSGEGYLSSRIGIGKTPTEKIDVAGGAYCDGTNWVNASDKNSKENFRKIDAEELLQKIAELQITEWNYKGEQGVTHIGPTAQDFKKSFGVGKNDKSISTIDPSGIALAAIQALKSENDDLRAQIAELREMIRVQANKQR